jgi:hypothetical protein
MVWINIDIPIKQITYHYKDNCTHVEKKKETEYEGVGEIKRDGCWLQFADLSEVIEYYKEKYPDFAIFQHC